MDKISRQPADDNCVVCHAPTGPAGPTPDFWNTPMVKDDTLVSDGDDYVDLKGGPRSDWAKRGFFWGSKKVDTHFGLGCKGCHMDTDKQLDLNRDGTASTPYTHMKDRCSPAKGVDPLGTAQNSTDNTVLYCQDCHYGVDSNGTALSSEKTQNAPDPRYAHVRAGVDGHTDSISCGTCHTYKKGSTVRIFDFSTNKGKFPTFVAGNPYNDPESDTDTGGKIIQPGYTWKTDPYDGSHKLYPFNFLTAVYWKNVAAIDVNGDGTTGDQGLDYVLGKFSGSIFNYIANAKGEKIPIELASDTTIPFKGATVPRGPKGNAIFTNAEQINGAQAALANLTLPDGSTGMDAELVFQSEPFGMLHNIVKTDEFVLGKPTYNSTTGEIDEYGCDDCHGYNADNTKGQFFMAGYSMTSNAVLFSKDADGNTVKQGTAYNVTADYDQATSKADLHAHAGYHNHDGTPGTLVYATVDTSTYNSVSLRTPKLYEFMGYFKDTDHDGVLDSDADDGVDQYGNAIAGATASNGIPDEVEHLQEISSANKKLADDTGVTPADVSPGTVSWGVSGAYNSITTTASGNKLFVDLNGDPLSWTVDPDGVANSGDEYTEYVSVTIPGVSATYASVFGGTKGLPLQYVNNGDSVSLWSPDVDPSTEMTVNFPSSTTADVTFPLKSTRSAVKLYLSDWDGMQHATDTFKIYVTP